MSSLFRFAHISDLHFAKPTWSPSQFFSKRWLGNLNLLFSRQLDYTSENLYPLIDTFTHEKITHVIITGDVSTTSTPAEFNLGKDFVSKLQQANFTVFILPGNHDHYTKRAYQSRSFYRFFDTPSTHFNLKTDGVAIHRLGQGWWLVTLDTAIATSLISSCGLFSSTIEENLKRALALIPSDEMIILANHFPFFHNDTPRKILKRGDALKELIQSYPNIRFYLHGHTHRHCIADLRPSKLPIVVDSGSTAHRTIGSWNLIDIGKSGCSIEPFYWKKHDEKWAPKDQQKFKW
jgi:3',5'-cyclic AMP phosphodiesterase CpdA